MPPAGGKVTVIDQGLIDRISGAVKGAIRGARDAWFGPLEPIDPVAPPEVKSRQLDYPVGFNIALRPRSEGGENAIDFPTLRALADPTQGGFDLLRLAIETRKDQMQAQRWGVRGRDGSDGGSRARAVEGRLRFPDGFHTFAQWQRQLLEDLLVIDQPAVYLAPDGTPEIMDGGLLKRLMRADGRIPRAPEPAYQQVLKGLPAVQYTTDEIVCMPRNLRSHRVYGMSPVEQVVMTVQIALRRQVSQLEYYTAGSVPDVVFGTPESWSADQVRQFQMYWDSILSGDTAERRRARFVPGGVKPYELKPGALKDEFDDWLARIICYCFSLSAQALMKQMNRATAQTAKQSAQEEGLEPTKLWFKDLMDAILLKAFKAEDLEFAWQDEEIADPEVKANVCATGLGKGGGKAWWTPDEVRAKFGDKPMTPAQREELSPPAPVPVVGEDGEPAVPPSSTKTVKFQRDAKGMIVKAVLS